MLKWKSNDISHNVEQPQQPASELVVPPTGSKGSNTKKPVTSVKSGKLISHTVSPKRLLQTRKMGTNPPARRQRRVRPSVPGTPSSMACSQSV